MRSFFGSSFCSFIQVGIYALVFLAPWDHWLHLDGNQNTWLLLASLLGLTGWVGFSAATKTLLVLAIGFALAAGVLRSWASALPNPCAARGATGSGVTTAARGSYRSLINPKALGTVMSALSLSILMPPSGSCLCLVLTLLWQLASIRSRERFAKQTGDTDYRAYGEVVPGVLPHLPFQVSHGTMLQRRWGRAVVSEVFTWGIAVSFLILGWRYNTFLIVQGIIVSLGVALISQAIVPRGAPATPVSSREG